MGNGRKRPSSRARRGHRPRAQERGFPGARGPEYDEEPRSRRLGEAAQDIERLDQRLFAAKEYAGIHGLEGLKSAIGRPLRLAPRRPVEEARIDSEALQLSLKLPKSLDRKAHPPLLLPADRRDAKRPIVFTRDERHEAMGFLKAKQLRVGCKLLDQHDKDGLFDFARELVFVAALLRIEPVARD